MKKIKVAFIKYAGLSAGGTERWLQTMAANVDKERFEVDFFYCDATPYLNNDYKHPGTDPYRKAYMQEHGINLIEFNVKLRDASRFYLPWIESDFWEKFNESDYDLVQTAKSGNPEYPYIFLKQSKVVEYVTLAGGVDLSDNIKRTIHLSKWQLFEWVKSGGKAQKADIIPIPVELPCSNENFRKELGIPEDAIVCGFHQRNEDTIFSPVQLKAFSEAENKNCYMLVLGGGQKYRLQAKELGLKNIHFLEHSGDARIISTFLNTLDIFTHGRKDGETFGTVLAEAMIHKVPCISHYVLSPGANAMPETIGPGGYVVQDEEEYKVMLHTLIDDKTLRASLAEKGYRYAMEHYTVEKCVNRLEAVWSDVLEGKNRMPFAATVVKRGAKDWKMVLKNYMKYVISLLIAFKGGK